LKRDVLPLKEITAEAIKVLIFIADVLFGIAVFCFVEELEGVYAYFGCTIFFFSFINPRESKIYCL
jgi:hypothetical protein